MSSAALKTLPELKPGDRVRLLPGGMVWHVVDLFEETRSPGIEKGTNGLWQAMPEVTMRMAVVTFGGEEATFPARCLMLAA